MSVESAADLAVFFNADEFAKAAVYTPPGGGAAVACDILIGEIDSGASLDDGRPIVGQKTVTVAAAQVAAPAIGGTFTLDVGGRVLTISNRPQLDDIDGATWTMWAE
jgi:hypothetical protein